MGLKSQAKGRRSEQEVVRLARSHGLDADRLWATAQSSDETTRKCDVMLHGLRTQVKLTASGFKKVYDALAGVDCAFVREDHKGWLVVLRAEDFLRMLRADRERMEQETGLISI